jgi:hypothetical protein
MHTLSTVLQDLENPMSDHTASPEVSKAKNADALLAAAKRVMAAKDEVEAWLALGWPARTLVPEPDRRAAEAAFAALRAAIARAEV